jgi:hypothetical protein
VASGPGHSDLSPYQYLPRTNHVTVTPIGALPPIALRRVVAFGLGHEDLSPFLLVATEIRFVAPSHELDF